MILQNLIHKFLIGIKIIKLIKNWPKLTIYLSRDKHVTPLLELRNGLKFYTNNDILDVLAIIENFEFENNHNYFRFAQIQKKPIIIDIGANIGSFSIHAAMQYPDAKIFSYEPDPQNYEKLIKNIELNNIHNIRTFNHAVGKTNTTVLLYSDNDGNFGTVGSSIINTGKKSLEVQCETLENILKSNKITECDFLKIDCEGGEYDIILNSCNDVFKEIRSVALEYHPVINHRVNELESFLIDQEFKIVRIPNKKNSKYGLIYASK